MMPINERIMNHGAGCFDELVNSFSAEKIDEMNTGYIRDDYQSDFDFKYCVVFAYVKDWLIDKINSGFNDADTKELFEIYCSM